jgi:hypothetical protein
MGTGLAEASVPTPAMMISNTETTQALIEAVAIPASVSDRLQKLRSVGNEALALEQADIIRNDLGTLGLNQGETIDLLIRHLAVTQLTVRAEVAYRTIFGSQIALLKFLNIGPGNTTQELERFYTQAKAQFPHLYGRYPYEQYLNYLKMQGLIRLRGPNLYEITIAGREFLKWMAATGRSEAKPF